MLCHNCSADNPSFHHFCYRCGTELQAQTDPVPSTSPRQYSPTQDLQPELKKVSILFVDITNSVHLIHNLKPEDSTEYLDPTITALKQCAHRYGGMINRVDGDGMMVIFGAPVSYEDHALRACYAALDMLSDTRAAFDTTRIAIRIGIHSGEVLMKPFYNDFSVDYEALGPTVYLAHRMEVLASPNTAVISRETYQLVQKQILAQDAGPTHVKGLSEPVHIFQLQGRMTPQAKSNQKLDQAPFVGREIPYRQLMQTLDSLSDQQGSIVTIQAEAGMGKTRLVHQFLQQIDPNQMQLLKAGCDSHNHNKAFLLFSHLLRFWMNVRETDSQLEIAQKLRDRIAHLSPDMASLLSAFHFLLDLPIQNQTWNGLEPIQKQQQVRQAILSLIEELSWLKPLVILLEDLHWIDKESEQILEAYVSANAGRSLPIMLMTTFRPEYSGHWRSQATLPIELGHFSQSESFQFLISTLGSDPSLEPLCQEICQRCQGIPLYMEEMIHHLIDCKYLLGEKGHFTTALNDLPPSLPLTIHSVITTRVDGRSKLAKTFLQSASVIGFRFSTALLDYISDIPRAYSKHAIRELIQAGLIVASSDALNDDFQFKHALVHQVTYDTIPRERKRLIHASLVNAIEFLYKERLEEHIYRLAEHAYRGQYWHKAVEYYLKACYHAIGRSSHQQAVLQLDRGLEALQHLPLNKDSLIQRIDFLAVGMNALIPLGEQNRLVRDLKEAEALCAQVGEPKRTCSILCQLTNALWMTGKHDEALLAANKAVDLALATGHDALKIAAHYNLAMTYHAVGNFHDCIRLEEQLLAALSGDMEIKRLGWSGYPSVFARTFYGNSLVELGRMKEAEEVTRRGMEIADDARHPYSQVMIYDTYGYYLIATGEMEQARDLLNTALDLCEEFSIHTMIPAISARLGESLIGCGDYAAAGKVLERAGDPTCYQKGGRYTWFYLFKALAHYYLLTGNWENAKHFADKAYELTEQNGERAHHGWACLTLAKVMAQSAAHKQSDIRHLLDRALSIAKDKNMHYLSFSTAAFACHFALQSLDENSHHHFQEMTSTFASHMEHPFFQHWQRSHYFMH